MTRLSLLALVASPLILSACATPPQAPAAQAPAAVTAHRDGQLDFDLASGRYDCEHGQRVGVHRELQAAVNHRIQIDWQGRRYHLERDPSHSGLPRFEDRSSGLVWIDLPWKSVLLDGRTHKPLASECRTA